MKQIGFVKTACAALIIGAFSVATLGCQKQEGPGERAGKQVDKAVDKAGQKIEKAGDSIQNAVTSDKK